MLKSKQNPIFLNDGRIKMIEIKVPNIGDFSSVEIIEILVEVGDTISVNQSLVTVESDKASMEIPSTASGILSELKVKIGQKISEGTLVGLLEPQTNEVKETTKTLTIKERKEKNSESSDSLKKTNAPAELSHTNKQSNHVVVLGAGPGGYSAAFRAADLGRTVTLVERYPTLGGVCLNVGCIPSKALLHFSSFTDELYHWQKLGVISDTHINIDIKALRAYQSSVVSRLTSGLSAMARARGIEVIQGNGTFIDSNNLLVTYQKQSVQGQTPSRNIPFDQGIIATGSRVIDLPFLPKDPRIVDSTGALNFPEVPKRMLVIGGGIIGLEMATVFSRLGSKVDIVEAQDSLMAGADQDLVSIWQKFNLPRLKGQIFLKTRTISAKPQKDGIHVFFEGDSAPTGSLCYDLVLSSVGRRPNTDNIGLTELGIKKDEKGFICVDSQLRTNISNIFAIGDVVGQPMLAHKAVHEGHIAAEALTGMKSHFDAFVIPSVAYTDPEVAWVGITEREAKRKGLKIASAVFPWAASGRAIANGREEGITKLFFDPENQRVIGGAIVGTSAGDLISEIALAIEMGANAEDIAHTIHPHPTLSESIGMAAELYGGTCTDLPPPKRKQP